MFQLALAGIDDRTDEKAAGLELDEDALFLFAGMSNVRSWVVRRQSAFVWKTLTAAGPVSAVGSGVFYVNYGG